MKFLVNISICFAMAIGAPVFIDDECIDRSGLMDCTSLDGSVDYEAKRLSGASRVIFTRFMGRLSLTNLPDVRMVEVQYGDPDCNQLTNFDGRVVLRGEHGSISCQIDTTVATVTTQDLDSSYETETTQISIPTQESTLDVDETVDETTSTMTTIPDESDSPWSSTTEAITIDIKSILIPSIITPVIIIIFIYFCIRCFCHRCRRLRKQTDVEMGTLRSYRFHDANDEEIHFDVTGMKND